MTSLSTPFTVFCLPKDLEVLRMRLKGTRARIEPLPSARPDAAIEDRVWDPVALFPVLGAACLDVAGRGALKQALKDFPGSPLQSDDAVLEIGPDTNEAAVEAWALTRTIALAHELLAAKGRMGCDLAALRIEHEDLLSRYEQVTRCHAALTAPQRVHAGEIAPGARVVRLPAAPEGLRQFLPCKPKGLSEIDLLVARPPGDMDGTLRLAVELRHTDIRYLMDVPATDLREGWSGVTLPKAIEEDFGRADLRLSWRGEPMGAPAFALGAPTPLAEASAVIGTDTRLDAPLALRLWRGIPGLPVEPVSRPMAADNTDESPHHDRPARGVLSWNQIAAMCLAVEPPAHAPEEVITVREAEGYVILHPVEDFVSLGVIEDVTDGLVDRVTGLFHLARPDCAPVEVAIGVAPAAAAGTDVGRFLGPWTALDPLAWSEVSVETDGSLKGPKKLIVGSRMKGNASAAWAWAALARVELNA